MNPHATSILSQRGYSIAKSELTTKELKKFRQTLTIIPHVENEKYAFGIEPISIYKETPKRFYAPRFWGVQKFGPPNLDKLTRWISWTPEKHHDFPTKFRAQIRTLLLVLKRKKIVLPKDMLNYLIQFIPRFTSNITLRDYQQKILAPIIFPHLRHSFGGVLSVFCAWGKTIGSLWISTRLGVKTLVVCHITSMMQQWIDNIKKWMPDVRIGIVQQDTCDIDDKDIVIVSLKTAALKEFPKDTFSSFGFCIWDEIHLMATQLFSRAFQKLSVKYTLGLSATPYRKDRCDIIFQHYIGPVIYMAKRKSNSKVKVKCITLVPPKPIETIYNYKHDIQYSKMLTKLCYGKQRCICIAKDLVPHAREGRKILVLSDYIKHLKMLQKFIEQEKTSKDTFTTGLYIGEMKMAARLESQKCNIILGTYKLASVGMDIPDLDTEAMASPRKEIEQCIGRIQRKETQFDKLILDYTDDHGIFQGQGRVRKKFYRTYGFTVELIRMDYKGNIISKRKAPKRKNQKPGKKHKIGECEAPDIHAKAIKNGEMCKICKQGTKNPLFVDE